MASARTAVGWKGVRRGEEPMQFGALLRFE
jgi:hypothetical protein